MVFLGDTEPHHTSLWKIKFDKDYATIDTFVTLQQRFDKFLGIRYDYSNYYKRRENYYKSPSQNTEVSCNVIKENDNDNKWRFDTNDLNYQGCLKSNDIITLSIKNEIVKDRYEFLRGHDFQVNIGKEVYEEVVCHNKGIGVNDNWCIELIEKKFLDIIDDIESLSDLILRFNKLLIGPALSTNIKNGSVVALKHVSTGKYLSTIENLRYETGSKSQMVYLGGSELDRSSLWIIKFDKDFATTDTYINLQQRFGKFDKFLGMRYYYEYSARKYYYSSPSNHLEVSFIGANDNWCIELIEEP
ncbi:unnamed protein product [Rhizophagus irregularis]|nr:unnamed protein product [Rhizophagus irregularis]